MKRVAALLGAVAAIVLPASGTAAPSSCPGPGCMPAGTFSLPTAKPKYYAVTISGKASKAVPIALSINGPGAPTNTLITAFEGKPVVKGAVETATIYMAVTPRSKKAAFATAASSIQFEEFAPAGKFLGGGTKVAPISCKVFKSKYPAANLWNNFWADVSPNGATDAIGLIQEWLSGKTVCTE